MLAGTPASTCGGAFDSLRKSGGPLVGEIIVVDNASTDGSAELVEREYSEVTLVRSKANLGFARANNLGIKRATGDWLALVNSDVVVHPGCFDELVNAMEARPEVGLAGPKVFGRDGCLQPTCRRLPNIRNTLCQTFWLDQLFPRWPLFSGREMRGWGYDKLAEVEVLSGCFWMARRTMVEAVGGLDERFFFYAEDVDWCKRVWDAGWKVIFVPAATTTHFGGGSSANAPLRYSIELLRANLKYWKKHRGAAGQAAFYLLCLVHYAVRLPGHGLRLLAGGRARAEALFKFRRSSVCLRWLLTGKPA